MGLTLDLYDNRGPNSLLDGIDGRTRDISGGIVVMGTYYQPLLPDGKVDDQGVYKTSIGLGTGGGYGIDDTNRIF